MHSNKIKTLIRVFIASMLLFMVTSPLLMLRGEWASIVICLVFQSFTTVVISRLCFKIKPWQLFVTILVGGSIIDSAIRICYFTDTLGSLPEYVAILAAVITGYLVFKLINLKSFKNKA